MSDNVTNPAAPALPISDVQNIVKIIDYCADQGVFKGWETIEQVFSYRTRVVEFLKSVVPVDAPVVSNEAPPADGPTDGPA